MASNTGPPDPVFSAEELLKQVAEVFAGEEEIQIVEALYENFIHRFPSERDRCRLAGREFRQHRDHQQPTPKPVQRLGSTSAKVSMAGVLRAFRRILRDYRHPSDSRHSLCRLLQCAIIDNYSRGSKASRVDIRKKREQPPGPPDIRYATRAQIKHAKLIVKMAQNG